MQLSRLIINIAFSARYCRPFNQVPFLDLPFQPFMKQRDLTLVCRDIFHSRFRILASIPLNGLNDDNHNNYRAIKCKGGEKGTRGLERDDQGGKDSGNREAERDEKRLRFSKRNLIVLTSALWNLCS